MRPAVRIIVKRRLPYADGLRLQMEILSQMRAAADYPETLIFAEHLPVITLGRAGDPRHLKVSAKELARRGIDFQRVTRGGDITYHGPGQWTVYPLLRLGEYCRDLHRYLRLLEASVTAYLQTRNLRGGGNPLNSGVWLGQNKIAAVGVACSGWISWHGFAVNVQPDLRVFTDLIVPCGVAPERGGVTSLQNETGLTYDMETERESIAQALIATLRLPTNVEG
ncbi:MAG: lipoyl(octanoyl) transferase LipB [Planctomycetota bacterium]|jgi:lipoate-protein ligase B|nr:lipoyl(octanoyl) transferase LipB [Planctomycetota bacterium]